MECTGNESDIKIYPQTMEWHMNEGNKNTISSNYETAHEIKLIMIIIIIIIIIISSNYGKAHEVLFVCFDALRPSKQLWSCRDITSNFMGLLPGIEMK